MPQPNSIRNGIIILIAFVIAIWLGMSLVTEQGETLIKFFAAALIMACIFLGRKIWLLLIFFMALNVPLIRGFSTTELGQALFIGFSLVTFLMRRLPMKVVFGEKEIWVLLVACCVLQVYLRNPVGLNMFGADNVGARPYFRLIMAFLSSLVLGNILVRTAEIRWVLRLSILGSIMGVVLSQFRTGLGAGPEGFERANRMDDGQGAGRIIILSGLSVPVARIVVAFVSPLRGLAHPFWGPLIVFSLFAAAMSGYRNTVASVGMILLLGLAYRSGRFAVIMSSVAAAFALGLLAFVNVLSPLPPNIQRALSPFPGTWEKRHVENAEASTEWRVEMWKEALFTDYWIRNKILGDGLGFTRKEMLIMQDLKMGGAGLGNRGSGMTRQQEGMMVTGGYHSGPVQTVRTVGYVGLLVLVLAMSRMAVHAHRQILRCRGTEWYPLALFMCVPMVIQPVFFVFIFGDFGGATSYLMFSYAIISLFEKNLPIPSYVKPVKMPYILRRPNSSHHDTPREARVS